MTTESIQAAWDAAVEKAKESPPGAGEYVIVRMNEAASRDIYGGVDNEGNLLLAVGVRTIPPAIDIKSAALDYFRQERQAMGGWVMVFRLRRAELAPVFSRFSQDLIDMATKEYCDASKPANES
ncbi:MAG: hypothetical protein EON58_08495, partial [Alphaproteobacteria bacterium]